MAWPGKGPLARPACPAILGRKQIQVAVPTGAAGRKPAMLVEAKQGGLVIVVRPNDGGRSPGVAVVVAPENVGGVLVCGV